MFKKVIFPQHSTCRWVVVVTKPLLTVVSLGFLTSLSLTAKHVAIDTSIMMLIIYCSNQTDATKERIKEMWF